jgi:hypothetical protein
MDVLYHYRVGSKCSYHKEKNSIQKLFDQTTHDYWLVNEYTQSFGQESKFFVKVKLSLSMSGRHMGGGKV